MGHRYDFGRFASVVVDLDGLFSDRFDSDRFFSDGMPAFDVVEFIFFTNLILMSVDFQVFPCWSITWHRTKDSLEAFSTLKFIHEVIVTEVRSPDFSFC